VTRKQLACTAVLGIALAVVLLRPALTDLDANLPGTGTSENLCGAWVNHSAQQAILEEGRFPLVHRGLAFEEGGRVYPLCLLNVLLTLPLALFLDAPGIYSASLGLDVALAFVFAMLLLVQLGRSWWAALPGALLFTLSPYLLSHLVHGPPESITFAWVLPPMMAAERLGAKERFSPALAALTGVLVAVCFASSPYNGLFAALLVVFCLFTRHVSRGPLRARFGHAGLALAVAGVLVAPLVWAIRHTLGHPLSLVPGRIERHASGQHVELLDSRAVQDVVNLVLPTERFHNVHYPEHLYLGLFALALVAVAMLRTPAARRWGWLALGGAVFCLGGTLQVAGHAPELLGGPVRLPAGLLCRIPPLSAISHPHRFEPVVLLAMGAAITLWLARWGNEGESRGPRWWQSLGLSALILVDLSLMYPASPLDMPVIEVPVPAFYEELADDPDEYWVLDLPVAPTTQYICVYYRYQLIHDKLVPYDIRDLRLDDAPAAAAFAEALSLDLEYVFDSRDDSAAFACSLDRCDGVDELAERGFRYVVLHELGAPRLDGEIRDCLERCLAAPVHADGQVRVYDLTDYR